VDALVPLLRPADATLAQDARAVAARWASEGYRILAFADRDLPSMPEPVASAEAGLHLLGLVAMADPPRPESAAAVAACHRAGVAPVMITGDDARTANAVARRVGVLDGAGGVVTGPSSHAWTTRSWSSGSPPPPCTPAPAPSRSSASSPPGRRAGRWSP